MIAASGVLVEHVQLQDGRQRGYVAAKHTTLRMARRQAWLALGDAHNNIDSFQLGAVVLKRIVVVDFVPSTMPETNASVSFVLATA